MSYLLHQRHPQRGQAMTELAIIAAAFLVPLFLLIPLLGKQIDIKHSAIQAARYQAWEYTVWYSGAGERPRGFSAVTQPVKSTTVTQEEAQRRFFSDTTIGINTNQDRQGWSVDDSNPLWYSHTGLRLYSTDTGPASYFSANQRTPDVTGVLVTILGILETVFGFMADIAAFLNINVGFTAINSRGYFHTGVDAMTREVTGFLSDEPIFAATHNVAQAGVMADGWNAGGRAHAEFQTGGIVPSKILGELLSNEPFQTAMSIIGIFMPEFRPCDPTIPLFSGDAGSLWLGHIDFDTVHPDRLLDEDGNKVGKHECDDGGFCTFDPEPDRTPTVVSSRTCAYVAN